MSRLFDAASKVAIGLTAVMVVALTVPGFAQVREAPVAAGDVVFEPAAADQPVADRSDPIPAEQPDTAVAADRLAVPVAASLRAAVSAMEHREPEDEQLRCLAAGIYFEAKGEPLEGQLAVGHVIVTRSQSGRFATSMCGVLTQRGQFSFVRGGVVPTPASNSQWRTAVAVARIARDGAWRNPVPGAMYFHAARVSPGWNRLRIAQLGNHVFYR